MIDDEKNQEKQEFDLGDYFLGFLFAALSNGFLISILLFGIRPKTTGLAFFLIICIFAVNIVIISKLAKERRSFARGWGLVVGLLALPLLIIGVCIGSM